MTMNAKKNIICLSYSRAEKLHGLKASFNVYLSPLMDLEILFNIKKIRLVQISIKANCANLHKERDKNKQEASSNKTWSANIEATYLF